MPAADSEVRAVVARRDPVSISIPQSGHRSLGVLGLAPSPAQPPSGVWRHPGEAGTALRVTKALSRREDA